VKLLTISLMMCWVGWFSYFFWYSLKIERSL